MATALQLDIDPPAETLPATTGNAGVVLMDREKFNAWYKSLKAKAPTDADVATRKGREELRSFAATVRSEKAAIDKARLRLTKEWRDMTAQANAAGKEIEQQLEALAVEVRKPLTEWEEAEKAREQRVKDAMDLLRSSAGVGYEETSAQVRDRLAAIKAMPIDPVEFDGYHPQAMALQAQTIEALTAAAQRIEEAEAKELELQRLRAAEEARLAKEAEAQAERDRIEAERLAAEEAERRRVAAEQAEAERIRQAEERAAQAARDEEVLKARQAEEERIREHFAALAEERRQREEAERVAREEREAREHADAERAAQERAAAAEQERIAEETRKREKNKAHRVAVMSAAKEAIMTCGADEDTSRKIVLAIIAGGIPAVTLSF